MASHHSLESKEENDADVAFQWKKSRSSEIGFICNLVE